MDGNILSILDLENTLKCPVCFELRDGHVYTCNSGHHLCFTCRESLQSCPLCQSALSFVRNFAVETLISRFEFLQEAFVQEQGAEIQENEMSENQESGQTPDNIFNFSTSDFATVMKTTAFVDKTLMIKDIFNSSCQILITAPPRFGKSTNLNMIKRFVEIEVNEYGQQVQNSATTRTENYRLFKDNNLDICNYDDLFDEHFGKYPVIYTDWKALGNVSDYASTIEVFRKIVVEAFSLHGCHFDRFINYFKRDDVNFIDFKKYFSYLSIRDMDVYDLTVAFKNLSTVLHRFFNKKVFVCIDNYDSFFNNILVSENSVNNDAIIFFINTVLTDLLQNNHCVGRAILTGVLPLTGDGFPLHQSNVDCFPFLANHVFCKYYGLTPIELNRVIDKLENDAQERLVMKKTIYEYYNCYTAENQNVQVYNIWSILQYIRKRKVQSYWCNHECIAYLKSCLRNQLIQNTIKLLLCGHCLQLDILHPFSSKDVLQINIDSRIDRVFLLFYHHGYLSVNRVLDKGFVDLNIPSEEIKYELAEFLLKEFYTEVFIKNINKVGSVVDLFQSDSPDKNKTCETFVKALQVMNNCQWLKSDCLPVNFLTGLFIGLVTVLECSLTATHKVGPDDHMVILLKNKHNVAICITAKRDASHNPTDKTRYNTAVNAHKYITDNAYDDQVFGKYDDLCGKILIAIGFTVVCGMYDISIVYSYFFESSDNLQDYKSLSSTDTSS